MGFISYSLDFYKKKLQELESGIVTEKTIYRAKQLLKMLDDLVDEGYTELNEQLEDKCQGVSRLQNYIRDNHAEPFKLGHKLAESEAVSYGREDLELTEAITDVMARAEVTKDRSSNHFLQELIGFCEWIGYEGDTAYIFLLRDTLLPYVYFKEKGRNGIYPWLLGRRTLSLLSGKEAVDDEIRACIFKALEYGQCKNFDDFCNMVLPDIRETIRKYPEMEMCLTQLLSGIPGKQIMVIESGCMGTFPMLLMSLDKRVTMRMYTTYPYLVELYGDKIYTAKYEENRLFETLYAHDLYFQFSDLRDGCFFVRKCEDAEVESRTLAEIKTMLEQQC